MKKLVTALLLAASVLSPATSFATTAPDAEIDTIAAVVDLDGTESDVQLDEVVAALVDNENILTVYCSDESYDALARIDGTFTTDDISSFLDQGYVGDYEIFALGDGSDVLASWTVDKEEAPAPFFDTYEKEGDERSIVLGLYGPRDATPSYYVTLTPIAGGETQWATFPSDYEVIVDAGDICR
jgi:hypothetical protein